MKTPAGMLSRRGFRLLYSGLPLSGAAVSGALLSGGADGSASSSEPPMFRVKSSSTSSPVVASSL